MKILFTGADGYIGSVLGPRLLERGHQATGVDTGYYRRGWLFEDGKTRPKVVTKDIRHIAAAELRGFDAVVHLAELSNDPLSEIDEDLTMELNYHGSVALAHKCREAGVRRFVYASSCSVYGAGGMAPRRETSSVDPQTVYAKCKVLVERDVAQLEGSEFSPVFLRNATAFGASPRQRFDLVLNNLAGWAFTQREIRMTSDGAPWRPIVHIEDICEAIVCSLEAQREAVTGQIFNIGSDNQNFRVREIAELVAGTFKGCDVTFGRNSGDTRSYRVAFEKVRAHLPEFRCRWDAARGAAQLLAVFERIRLSKEDFEATPFTRLKELKFLQRTGQLDRQLFWTRGQIDPTWELTSNAGQVASFEEITDTGRGHAIPTAGSL